MTDTAFECKSCRAIFPVSVMRVDPDIGEVCATCAKYLSQVEATVRRFTRGAVVGCSRDENPRRDNERQEDET